MTHDVIGTAEAAAMLGITPGAARVMRCQNRGPAYIKLGGRTVAYLRADVEAYLVEQSRQDTKAS